MQAYPLLFTPSYHERIWGGTRLKDFFGYPIPSHNTGEAWVISDHPNGRSTIANGVYQGKTIQDLLLKHPDWFSMHRMQRFPILVKLLDAQDDLSVQVHPDDDFAAIHENGEMGKSECWYIVHAEPGAEIVYGHTAESQEELVSKIKSGRWKDLLVRVPVRTGDFFYIPNGTIHALGKGIVVLETQQNSDTTYRAYDYDRIDASGRKRELHIDKVLQVTKVPFATPLITARVKEYGALKATNYLQGPYFTVEKWTVRGTHSGKTRESFILVSVLSGSGRLVWTDGEIPLQKGDHLLLPRTLGRYQLCGEWEAIASWLPEQKIAA
ncbi:mannose-6-phosphate isomerase, class I [Effusibacillus dendaii]|uniref:Mannose-6-phosphate isomerase n=1 Tax=Effusibacillus dendaii TaxID=2743772 RepID=A0A7I8D6P8_9BACL|nr:mannose-6-phosphate isomerase, class I [Effusibacillus dendaii]BCJ85677.1 mannose-6-phosphate isomerase ManA [Effusibacillus dendaii]